MNCCKHDFGLYPHNEAIVLKGLVADIDGIFTVIAQMPSGSVKRIQINAITGNELIIPQGELNEDFVTRFIVLNPNKDNLTIDSCENFSLTVQVDVTLKCPADYCINEINEQMKTVFYLDGNANNEGDGTANFPFKTLSHANTFILSLDQTKSYVLIVMPFDGGYGTEVVGELTLAPTLSIIGFVPGSTGIACNLKIVAPNGSGLVNQYRNIAMNGTFTMDLGLASFTSLALTNGAFNINRIDNNTNGFVILSGGLGNSTVRGNVLIQSGVLFGNVSVKPGSKCYVSNIINLGGKFLLEGNSMLKTLGVLNPPPDYVDGTPDGSGTPDWFTDSVSNESNTGTVNKTVY